MFIESKTERERWNRLGSVLLAIEVVVSKHTKYIPRRALCWDCDVPGARSQMSDMIRSIRKTRLYTTKLLTLEEKIKEAEEQGFLPSEKMALELAELRTKSQSVVAPEFSGFWSEILKIFSKEGISTDDFLLQMELEDQSRDPFDCLKFDWIAGWLYHNIH